MGITLSNLSHSVLWFIEDQLSNNEFSDDDELKKCFMQEGLSPEQADEALSYRDRYLNNIYVYGLTPIRHGSAARVYNPRTRQVEPDPTA